MLLAPALWKTKAMMTTITETMTTTTITETMMTTTITAMTMTITRANKNLYRREVSLD